MIWVVIAIVVSLGLLGSLIGAASEKTELLRVVMALVGAGLFVGCLVADAALFMNTATSELVVLGVLSGIGLGLLVLAVVQRP